MQGQFFNFLTNSYVEALGLEKFAYRHPEPFVCMIPEFSNKPVSFTGWDLAVVYNHGLYLREPDGLAWVRKP